MRFLDGIAMTLENESAQLPITAETERQSNGVIVCWVIRGDRVINVKASPIAQVIFDWLDFNHPGTPNTVNIQNIK